MWLGDVFELITRGRIGQTAIGDCVGRLPYCGTLSGEDAAATMGRLGNGSRFANTFASAAGLLRRLKLGLTLEDTECRATMKIETHQGSPKRALGGVASPSRGVG
jgi:hypothetical protein